MTEHTANGQIADTHGWDTAFGIRFSEINEDIRKTKSSPATFQYSAEDGSVSIEGTFGDWQLTTNSDGFLVHVELPVNECSITLKGVSQPMVIKNASAVLEIQLAFFETTPADADPASGTLHHLKVKTTPDSRSVDGKVATWVGATFATPPDFDVEVGFRAGILGWANANLGDFGHIFATINLNAQVAQQQFQWMVPTTVDYACVSGDTDTVEDCVLGVLCMTEGRSSEGLQQSLSPNILKSHPAGLLISQNRLLEKLLRPSMVNVFPGSKLDDYPISTDGTKITLGKGSVSFTVTDKKDNKEHKCQLTDLEITISGEKIKMDVTTVSDIGGALKIKAFCQTTTFQKVKLGKNTKGAQTLVFDKVTSPEPSHWTQAPPGVEVAQFFIGLAAAVAAEAVTVLTDGAGTLVGLLIVGLVVGLLEATPEIIEAAKKNDAPSIDMMVLNATKPIKWSGDKIFHLAEAGVNGSLQLNGALTAA